MLSMNSPVKIDTYVRIIHIYSVVAINIHLFFILIYLSYSHIHISFQRQTLCDSWQTDEHAQCISLHLLTIFRPIFGGRYFCTFFARRASIFRVCEYVMGRIRSLFCIWNGSDNSPISVQPVHSLILLAIYNQYFSYTLNNNTALSWRPSDYIVSEDAGLISQDCFNVCMTLRPRSYNVQYSRW